ncbi:MAG: hypothetical protein IJ491_02585 [Clostridia bacterium]|nr:hypothetical protein [Clostridia bacterium]
MKRFLNFFYTISFKILLFIVMLILSWFAGEKLLNIVDIYIEDPVGARNVVRQWNGFDYESSVYLESEIESTIENVLLYCLKYNSDEEIPDPNDKKILDYYRRMGNEGYRETAEYLDSLKNVSYAVVNHSSNKILSNIKAINGKSSGTAIRSFFGNVDKTTLIVRNAKNPYFEAGTMEDYVDFVSECAMNYSDDFDLYISFGNDFAFRYDVSHYENLYNETKQKTLAEMKKVLLFSVLCLLVMTLIFILSGKSEVNGKTIPSALDRLPNDIHFFADFVISLSLTALFENSIYMLFRSAFADGDYWLGISPEFYALRANVCIVAIGCIVLASACTIKRQHKMKTLFTNTYIYRIIKGYKPDSDEE